MERDTLGTRPWLSSFSSGPPWSHPILTLCLYYVEIIVKVLPPKAGAEAPNPLTRQCSEGVRTPSHHSRASPCVPPCVRACSPRVSTSLTSQSPVVLTGGEDRLRIFMPPGYILVLLRPFII